MQSKLLNLSEKEIEARDLFLKIYSAYDKPIDSGNIGDLKIGMPEWFDELKFKKGQEFSRNNRLGIQTAGMSASVCLLADPPGLEIIRMTNKSNTEETARKRYVKIILHITTWYDHELSRDSATWKSLNRIRRIHLHVTQLAMKREKGIISQTDITMAIYEFIGFTIGLPHNIGVSHTDKEGRAGFIHFWAVMAYMLGVEDQYNICLRDMELVEIMIDIFRRYIFIPMLQIETKDFKHSAESYCLGLDYFFGNLTYGSLLFLTRRALGIPGYQYSVDAKYLNIIKDIFTEHEILQLRKYMSRNKQLQRFPDIYLDAQPHILVKVISGTKLQANERFLSATELVGLGYEPEEIVIKRTVPYDQWSSEFNDSQLYKLSEKDQQLVKSQCSLLKKSEWFYIKWIVFVMTKFSEYRLRWWYAKHSKLPLFN